MMSLTEGAIQIMSNADQNKDPDFKPVLQVHDLKLVTQNNNSTAERYRMMISDGTHLQQGMLATQRNDLVHSQLLRKGSVIQLNQFVTNVIQGRMIIIIIDLEVLLDNCEPIGDPKPLSRSDANASSPAKPPISGNVMNPQSLGAGSIPGGIASRPNATGVADQNFPSNVVYGGAAGSVPGGFASRSNAMGVADQSFSSNGVYGGGAGSVSGGLVSRPNLVGTARPQNPMVGRDASSYASNSVSAPYNSARAHSPYSSVDSGSGMPRAPGNSYQRPPQSSYQQPPSVYLNRGPLTKNEPPARIIPIAALNPYQGRWTIKARVTAKGELRQYNNTRGEGKVFSFDLLDASSEIRVTCFNAVADQFYEQIQVGKVYLVEKGTLLPAQKNFNHLQNDHEIRLDNFSIIKPCFEDDVSIPQQNWNFRSICDIEGMENNSLVDLIGVVSSISPSSTIMRKNGTEAQKRTLQMKDMSGRSVEITLWGNFCNAEGQTLQNMCDSGANPVLAIKTGRVNDFNGKAVGTISNSQLFIEPDFPEAHKLRDWFETNGKNTPAVSISRDSTSMARTDVRKTVSQIKDERLGTSEKPDWITISGTLIFIKVDNFCYPACPLKIGDRQCNKKVSNNGDGKWRCERCDQTVDECDYRYILQLQIQDHTGLTWVTAFQESGEDIIGLPAKDLYHLKHEEQDDDRFNEIIRNALFKKYMFKLKVKEETFSDEQRVKSTLVKADKLNFEAETRTLFGLIEKMNHGDLGSAPSKSENGLNPTGLGVGNREPPASVPSYNHTSYVGRDFGMQPNQGPSLGSQYGGYKSGATTQIGIQTNCNNCGGSGHNSINCPVASNQRQSYGGVSSGPSVSGAVSGECFKCHQVGHWARDCPNAGNAPPAYGRGSSMSGRYGSSSGQHVGGF